MLKVPNPEDKVRIFIFILSKGLLLQIFYFPERNKLRNRSTAVQIIFGDALLIG